MARTMEILEMRLFVPPDKQNFEVDRRFDRVSDVAEKRALGQGFLQGVDYATAYLHSQKTMFHEPPNPRYLSVPAPVHPDHCGDASCTVCPTVAELGPVSNTLRERIEALVQECDLAYSEADHHNAYTHGFGKGMSAAGSRLRTLLSLLDKKEVK